MVKLFKYFDLINIFLKLINRRNKQMKKFRKENEIDDLDFEEEAIEIEEKKDDFSTEMMEAIK